MFNNLVAKLEKNHMNMHNVTVINVTLRQFRLVVIYKTEPLVGGLPTERVAVMDYDGRIHNDIIVSH